MNQSIYAEEIVNLLDRIRDLEACQRSLETRILQLTEEKHAWRHAFRRCTPGGSAFQTPEECSVYVQVKNEEMDHKIVKLTKELDDAWSILKRWSDSITGLGVENLRVGLSVEALGALVSMTRVWLVAQDRL